MTQEDQREFYYTGCISGPRTSPIDPIYRDNLNFIFAKHNLDVRLGPALVGGQPTTTYNELIGIYIANASEADRLKAEGRPVTLRDVERRLAEIKEKSRREE